jgi:hypothetical protein
MRRWLPISILFTALLARAESLADELTAAGIAEFTAAADYFRKALAQHPADHAAKEGLARVTEKK